MSTTSPQPTYRQLIEARAARRRARLRLLWRWAVPGVGVALLLIGILALTLGSLEHRSSLEKAEAAIAAHRDEVETSREQLRQSYTENIAAFSNVSYQRTVDDDKAARAYVTDRYVTGVPGLSRDTHLSGFRSYVTDDAGRGYTYFAHITVTDDKNATATALMTYTVEQNTLKNVTLTWAA